MAKQHGRNAQLYVNVTSGGTASPLLYAASSDISLTTDKVDVTAFGDTTKTYVTGLPDGTINFSGFASDAAGTSLVAAALDGVARKFYFYPFGGSTIYFFGTGFFDWKTGSTTTTAVVMSGSMVPATGVSNVGF